MIIIPQQKTWTQPNNSDVIGSLWASFGLDVTDRIGKLRVSGRMLVSSNNSDSGLSTLFCPVAFKYHNTAIYTLGGGTSSDGHVFKTASSGELQSQYTIDGSSNAPADIDSRYSDMEIGSGKLYVTSPTKLYECTSAGVWNSSPQTIATNIPHPLAYFQNRIYVQTSQGQIQSAKIYADSTPMDSLASINTTYTLQFPNSGANVITSMRASASRLWICTVNTSGGKGYIYEWDGTNADTPNKAYRLESSGALACVIKNDIPYVIDTNGNLLYWDGGSFEYITGVNRKNRKLLTNPIANNNTRFIHPNGMSIIHGNIHTFVNGKNNDNTGTQEETIPSGVYEYITSTVTTPTGQQIQQSDGLIHKSAIATAKSSDTIQDFGQVRVSQVGAVSELIVPSSPSASANGRFLCGCAYFTDATTVAHAVLYNDLNDTKQKSGYFITTKQESIDEKGLDTVQNAWQNIFVMYRKFLNSTDKIVVKYRTEEAEPVEATITWVSTTKFTTTTNVLGYWNGGTDGEVEILQGIGAGICSHITNIDAMTSGATTTYTVTVDETHTGATGTAKARFQSWKMIGISTFGQQTFDQQAIGPVTNWVQFKVWMLFTGKNEIEKLLLVNGQYQGTH